MLPFANLAGVAEHQRLVDGLTDTRVYVAVSLVDPKKGRVLWSDEFEEPPAALYTLQEMLIAKGMRARTGSRSAPVPSAQKKAPGTGRGLLLKQQRAA